MSNKELRNIVLVGFMGTGKSTVGALLAKQLGWEIVDVDAEIVQSEGRAIADIFEKDGEAAFRAIETAVLEKLLTDSRKLIIAAGGGAVLAERNRELMLKHGLVVALTATAEQIVERVKHDTARPLLQGEVKARVELLMEQRKHAYDFAPVSVDTTARSAAEVAAAITEQLETRIQL